MFVIKLLFNHGEKMMRQFRFNPKRILLFLLLFNFLPLFAEGATCLQGYHLKDDECVESPFSESCEATIVVEYGCPTGEILPNGQPILETCERTENKYPIPFGSYRATFEYIETWHTTPFGGGFWITNQECEWECSSAYHPDSETNPQSCLPNTIKRACSESEKPENSVWKDGEYKETMQWNGTTYAVTDACEYECFRGHELVDGYCKGNDYFANSYEKPVSKDEMKAIGGLSLKRGDISYEKIEGIPQYTPEFIFNSAKNSWNLNIPTAVFNVTPVIYTPSPGVILNSFGQDIKQVTLTLPSGVEQYIIDDYNKLHLRCDGDSSKKCIGGSCEPCTIDQCEGENCSTVISKLYFPKSSQKQYSYVELKNMKIDGHFKKMLKLVRHSRDGSKIVFDREQSDDYKLTYFVKEIVDRKGDAISFDYKDIEDNVGIENVNFGRISEVEITDAAGRGTVVKTNGRLFDNLAGYPDFYYQQCSSKNIEIYKKGRENEQKAVYFLGCQGWSEQCEDDSNNIIHHAFTTSLISVKLYDGDNLVRTDTYSYSDTFPEVKNITTKVPTSIDYNFLNIKYDNSYEEKEFCNFTWDNTITLTSTANSGLITYKVDNNNLTEMKVTPEDGKVYTTYVSYDIPDYIEDRANYSLSDANTLEAVEKVITEKDESDVIRKITKEYFSPWRYLLRREICDGNGANCATEKFQYNVDGELIFHELPDGTGEFFIFERDASGVDYYDLDIANRMKAGNLLFETQANVPALTEGVSGTYFEACFKPIYEQNAFSQLDSFCKANFYDSGTSKWRTKKHLYTSKNDLKSKTFFDGRKTEYIYDYEEVDISTDLNYDNILIQANGNIVKEINRASTGLQNEALLYSYYSNGMLKMQGVMESGVAKWTKGFTYNANKLIASDFSIVGNNFNDPKLERTYHYDSRFRKIYDTNPAEIITFYGYDNLDQVEFTEFGCTEVSNPLGNAIPIGCEYGRDYEYDLNGNLVKTVFKEYVVADTDGNITRLSTPQKIIQDTEYDFLGRAVKNCQYFETDPAEIRCSPGVSELVSSGDVM